MAVEHREYPVYGLQFHPESILTPDGAQMIRNIFKRFTNQTFRCPRPGQWYTTPAGHVLRVSLVDSECQKVICEPLGRSYRVSMPLIAFRSGKNMKHLGGAA